MISADQKVRDIIGHLAYQLTKGQGAFLVAKYIHEAQASKRINCAHYFFSITKESCIESAILALSRIIVPHGESISIQYLLNCVEQNHHVFSRADKQTIMDCVQRHRQQLDTVSSLVANIKEQRDRTVAHLDRKHVTNPSAVYTHPPLDYKETENIFELLLGIINTYAGYLSPSGETRLDNIDSLIAEDLDYLTGLIEQANARS